MIKDGTYRHRIVFVDFQWLLPFPGFCLPFLSWQNAVHPKAAKWHIFCALWVHITPLDIGQWQSCYRWRATCVVKCERILARGVIEIDGTLYLIASGIKAMCEFDKNSNQKLDCFWSANPILESDYKTHHKIYRWPFVQKALCPRQISCSFRQIIYTPFS